MRNVWMVGAVVAAFGAGCMNAAESVRHFAAQDLRCPADQVRVERIASGAYVARGCGAHTFYIDRNAPTAFSTPRTSGHYVTLAVAEH